MLAKPKTPDDPELVGAQPDPMNQAAPITFGYSAQNPSIESTTGYSDLSGGFGQRIQGTPISQFTGTEENVDRRYRFGSNVDCSIAGQIVMGPLITGVTPSTRDSTNGISGFFEIGGTLYAVNGRYVLYRADDATWSVSKDLGSGKIAVGSVVVKQNTSGSTKYAFIAMGDGEHYWYFNAASTTTTWTQHASQDSLGWALKGDFLYSANDVNNVRRIDLANSPIVEANWSSSSGWRLGDYSAPITKLLVNAAGTLVIFKQASIHVTDDNTNDIQLYPAMQWPASAENGKYAFAYENDIQVTYGGAHYRMDAGLNLEPIGPERFETNDSPVHGRITAGVGTPYCAFAGLYTPDYGHSFLMRFGALSNRFQGDPQRLDAWHGSLSNVDLRNSGFTAGVDTTTATFDTRIITAMARSTLGADSGHERVYIGCSDGTIFFFQLPCTANPLGCTNYKYAPGTALVRGRVFMPIWTGGFAKDEKVVRAVTVTATALGTVPTNAGSFDFLTRTASTDYSTHAYSRYSPGTTNTNAPGVRWPVDKTITVGDFVLELQGGGGASTLTPIITGVGVSYRVNPRFQLAFQLNILAENGLRKRNGVPMRIGADKIKALIKTVINTTAGVTVILPDESSQTCQFSGYTERMIAEDRTGQWRSVVTVICTQSDTVGAAFTFIAGDSSYQTLG